MAKLWYHYWKVIIEGTRECIVDEAHGSEKGYIKDASLVRMHPGYSPEPPRLVPWFPWFHL